MPFPALSAAVATAARSVGTSSSTTATDAELLREFACGRAEAAFAGLVHRLGPMVLGVCRRVSGDRHLAEDAFQAAFVVLARRAGDVRPAEAVRAWLYGVAVRTAREARAVSLHRLAREVPVPTVPDRAGEPIHEPDAEALAILDEEVAGLPDRLRAGVVLCEIDGVSRRDAAQRLGIPEGTLSSRLAKARKLLAARLRTRGVSPPTAGLTVLAHATVSPQLVAQTSALVSTAAPLPPAVAALSNGVFRTMYFQKLALGAACGLMLATVCFVVQFTGANATAQDPPKPPVRLVLQETETPVKKPPVAKPADHNTILLTREASIGIVSPDGKKGIDLTLPNKTRRWRSSSLSLDGKRIAFVVVEEDTPLLKAADDTYPLKVVISKLDKPAEHKVIECPAIDIAVAWTPDGKKLIAGKEMELPPNSKFESVLIDPEIGAVEALDLPAGVRVLDCTQDGKSFVVETFDVKAKKKELGIATTGQAAIQLLTSLKGLPGRAIARLSPDGKTLALIDGDPERKDAHKWGASDRPYLIDVKTKKRDPLAGFPENGRAFGITWSPDGKRLAYTWQALDEEWLKKDRISSADAQKETEGFLMIADADGKNAKTIVTDKGRFSTNTVLGWIDWR